MNNLFATTQPTDRVTQQHRCTIFDVTSFGYTHSEKKSSDKPTESYNLL
ncbi:hypothetical protein OH460_07900 [Vibrio sp. Makdt]|nr:hypothetical protein [Vibrio sp. Makdt]MDA0152220.1 hypothetical protein [Vibrio sp. Makdt]